MYLAQSLLRPHFWINGEGIAFNTVIANKNKDGIIKIFFFCSCIHKSF